MKILKLLKKLLHQWMIHSLSWLMRQILRGCKEVVWVEELVVILQLLKLDFQEAFVNGAVLWL